RRSDRPAIWRPFLDFPQPSCQGAWQEAHCAQGSWRFGYSRLPPRWQAPGLCTRGRRRIPRKEVPMSVYRPRDAAGKPKSPYWHFDFTTTLPSGEHRRFSGSTGLVKKADAQDFEKEKRRAVALGTGPGAITINQACWRYWDELGREFKGAREK